MNTISGRYLPRPRAVEGRLTDVISMCNRLRYEHPSRVGTKCNVSLGSFTDVLNNPIQQQIVQNFNMKNVIKVQFNKTTDWKKKVLTGIPDRCENYTQFNEMYTYMVLWNPKIWRKLSLNIKGVILYYYSLR